MIAQSLGVARGLANDVDLHLLMFDMYGKGFMKKCRVSPDAYIQMALQLAYFRVSHQTRNGHSNPRNIAKKTSKIHNVVDKNLLVSSSTQENLFLEEICCCGVDNSC